MGTLVGKPQGAVRTRGGPNPAHPAHGGEGGDQRRVQWSRDVFLIFFFLRYSFCLFLIFGCVGSSLLHTRFF